MAEEGVLHSVVRWMAMTSSTPQRHTGQEKYQRGTRSYTMSHIRGKDTGIELMVRSYLFSRGLRFRKNDKRYTGHPDVVLPRWHTIVFVNGCFWHAHEHCDKHSTPKSNVEFWSKKLLRNRERDAEQQAALREAGWRVLVVWECELDRSHREQRLKLLYEQITAHPLAEAQTSTFDRDDDPLN
jgi:DNA mismatch endonuclease (patch repair protein)